MTNKATEDNDDGILELNEDQQVDGDMMEAAQAEIAALKDKYLRAMAEMDNLRKRGQRDVEDAVKYSAANAAKPFLSVAENLKRALDSVPDEVAATFKTLFDGIRATQRELQGALEKMGIVAVDAKAGEALNPHEHEVMFEVQTEDQPSGTIVQVLETGYKIHDRLLRPARVSVAKNSLSSDKVMDVSA